MVTSADIQVSSHGVGTLTFDGDQARGEGGPSDPRVVLPVSIVLHARAVEEMLALTDIICSLHLDTPCGDHNRVGMPYNANLQPHMLVRSVVAGTSPITIEVRIPVNAATIAQIEERRHAHPSCDVVGYLRVTCSICWVYKTVNTDVGARDDHPFPSSMGMFSFLAPAWLPNVGDVPLRIPASTWVTAVLPGLGLDRLQLIEVRVPSPGDILPDVVVPLFDAARRDYDSGRYRECIQKCRDVRHAVEQHLGATGKNNPVADRVAARLGLPPDDPRHTFIDQTWQGLAALTSQAHHIAHLDLSSAADGRAALLLTASLLDYLGHLFAPPPIGLYIPAPPPLGGNAQ